MTLVAFILGAAWRRSLGSARPAWVLRLDARTPWRRLGGFPLRTAIQVPAGMAVLTALQLAAGEALWRAALEAALAVGAMTLPIRLSRRPFEWLAEQVERRGALPITRNDHLNGPAPWGEAMQGGLLWTIAIAL
jgi:hypothetical protein